MDQAPPSPPPPPTPRRNFALVDLLILVAALAAGMALCRPRIRGLAFDPEAGFLSDPPTRYPLWQVLLWPDNVVVVGSAMASMAMLGLLAVSLRPPRARRRALLRRPGFVACVAGAAAMAANGLEVGAPALFQDALPTGVWNPFDPFWKVRIGPSVIAAWLFLAGGGRWRSEAGWIDRAGRLLGLFWILATARPPLLRILGPWVPPGWWGG